MFVLQKSICIGVPFLARVGKIAHRAGKAFLSVSCARAFFTKTKNESGRRKLNKTAQA